MEYLKKIEEMQGVSINTYALAGKDKTLIIRTNSSDIGKYETTILPVGLTAKGYDRISKEEIQEQIGNYFRELNDLAAAFRIDYESQDGKCQWCNRSLEDPCSCKMVGGAK